MLRLAKLNANLFFMTTTKLEKWYVIKYCSDVVSAKYWMSVFRETFCFTSIRFYQSKNRILANRPKYVLFEFLKNQSL